MAESFRLVAVGVMHLLTLLMRELVLVLLIGFLLLELLLKKVAVDVVEVKVSGELVNRGWGITGRVRSERLSTRVDSFGRRDIGGRVRGRVGPRETGRTGLRERSGWVRARAAALCGVKLGVGDVR